MNRDLICVQIDDVTWKLGVGKRAHVVTDIGYNTIKTNVLGFSSTLEIAITVSENYVGVFTFTSNMLKDDSFLRALLFGRSTTNYQFTTTNCISAQLIDKYFDYCELIPIEKFDYSANCGIQFEEIQIENGAKKATYKQDKSQKIDYTKNGKRTQAKASLKHYGTSEKTSKSYSFSKTNKSAL